MIENERSRAPRVACRELEIVPDGAVATSIRSDSKYEDEQSVRIETGGAMGIELKWIACQCDSLSEYRC
jgi:hypothetical protein